MRQRIAKRTALSDVGRAENQRGVIPPTDIRVQGAAVEELEAEIDRLQKLNENQAQTIRVQAATIANLLAGDRAAFVSPIVIEADL
jgi:hypothetical protein